VHIETVIDTPESIKGMAREQQSMHTDPYWIDTAHPGRLAILPRPRGGDWLEDEARAWALVGIDVVVSLLEPAEAVDLILADEERACHAAGFQFHSLPIPDRDVPESRQAVAELAVTLADAIRSSKRVGVHCRQSVGRSAVLAACVLIALGIDADTALVRIAAARGLPVPETPEQRDWVIDFARRSGASP
jgi:Cyclin-dependent kinase inhibitor 3 (CDKN3)